MLKVLTNSPHAAISEEQKVRTCSQQLRITVKKYKTSETLVLPANIN